MAVKVEREPEDCGPPMESCCFCRKVTPFWVVNMDVACCQECAGRAEVADVPTKEVWCRRERISNARWKM